MKIAYLVTDSGIPVFGYKGASVHLRSITSALAAIGHEIEVLATNLEGENTKDENVIFHQIGALPKVRKQWRRLKKLAAAAAPDTCPANSDKNAEIRPKAALYMTEMMKMDLVGRAVEDALPIFKKGRFDIILERLSPFGAAGMIIADKLGLPRILEMNAPLSDESLLWRQLQFKEISRSLEYSCLKSADGIVVVSQALKNRLLKMSQEKRRILVLPNGVNPGFFSPGPKDKELCSRWRLHGKFVIGFSGSLKQWHGLDMLMRAFSGLARKYSHAQLFLVGDGPERERLQHLASELKISERVVFTGSIPYRHMPAYIRLMDIATAPYRLNGDFYFSPLKLMEYLACGIPVVASAGGEIKHLIRSGENGLLVSKVEPQALYKGLDSLFSDPDLRAKIAVRGGSLIQGRSWEDNARKTIDFMEERIAVREKNARP